MFRNEKRLSPEKPDWLPVNGEDLREGDTASAIEKGTMRTVFGEVTNVRRASIKIGGTIVMLGMSTVAFFMVG